MAFDTGRLEKLVGASRQAAVITNGRGEKVKTDGGFTFERLDFERYED